MCIRDRDLTAYANIAKGTKPGDFNSKVPTLSDGAPDESYPVSYTHLTLPTIYSV